MDNITTSLNAFQMLTEYTYDFLIAYNQNLHSIHLTFENKDFHHLAGFQYLNDIDIPKNHSLLFSHIKSGKISDTYLSQSHNYQQVKESYANVKSRIKGLSFLMQFIDNKNLICKYIKNDNKYSKINADYLIKSVLNGQTAYIFIRKRRNQENYCICSFFLEPQSDYNGQKAYWFYKAKTHLPSSQTTILYDKRERIKKEVS